MIKVFLELNDDSYLLEHLTYNPETEVFKILTESVIGKKSISGALKSQSTTFSMRNLYFNPPPNQLKSINQIFD